MDAPMLRILAALDGTPGAETILAALMPLARAADLHLTLFRVAEDDAEAGAARDYLTRLQGALALHRISARVEVATGEPGPVLLLRLGSGDFDFGAMTTHGRRGLDRILMGSVAETVVRSAGIPIFINRPDAKIGDWKKIIVALDGSKEAEAALEDAGRLARRTGSTLILVNVAEPFLAAPGLQYAYGAVTIPDMKPYLADVRHRLAAEGFTVEVKSLLGPPGPVIAAYAGEIGAGLIAMTTLGRGGIRRLLMGSVAESLFRTAPCPILVRPLGKVAGVRSANSAVS
jgi:nucleotide-binding universal stress UspA family protein